MCTTPAKTPRPRPSHEALCRGSAWAGEGPPRHAARSSAAEPGGNHTDGSPRGRFETRTQPSVGRKPPCASLFPPHHPTPRRCSLWGGRRLAAPCNRALAATPCAQPLNVTPPLASLHPTHWPPPPHRPAAPLHRPTRTRRRAVTQAQLRRAASLTHRVRLDPRADCDAPGHSLRRTWTAMSGSAPPHMRTSSLREAPGAALPRCPCPRTKHRPAVGALHLRHGWPRDRRPPPLSHSQPSGRESRARGAGGALGGQWHAGEGQWAKE